MPAMDQNPLAARHAGAHEGDARVQVLQAWRVHVGGGQVQERDPCGRQRGGVVPVLVAQVHDGVHARRLQRRLLARREAGADRDPRVDPMEVERHASAGSAAATRAGA